MENRIVMARNFAGLSQKELATKMGISPSTLNGYEKGNHDPKSLGLIAISNICNVTTDYLLGLTDIPNQASFDLTFNEQQIIKNYRTADNIDKEMIHRILHIEEKESKENLA